MLISLSKIVEILKEFNIRITGVLHIGAHECEEMSVYKNLGLSENDIFWLDALPEKLEIAKRKGIPNFFNIVVSDLDDQEVNFNITNSSMCCSMLDLKECLVEHPDIHVVGKRTYKTETINTFVERQNIDTSKLNFWNLDIQGSELSALKGANKHLQFADLVYTEINVKEIYKDCVLIEELDNYLSTFNFRRIHTQMTKHGWGDAIYIKDKNSLSLSNTPKNKKKQQ